MKTKIFILFASIVCLVSCKDGLWNAINELNDKYENLDGRVAKLEEKCKEMNTNISSLQTLVSVILNNDYIVSITPIMKENQEIGYTITFAIHEPITIYHGQNGADGKDGQNGKDGKDGKNGNDGVTPIIGVTQDETDHAYYWTLNGTWLLDANGNRVPLTSKDGKDGQDGITPQLKIENGYWYVSTDGGTTWTQLGKAVGENGQNGQDGKDGKDGTNGKDGKDGEKGEKGDPGDTMFSEVTQDDDFVYFKLSNGTILTVPKGYKEQKVQIVDGAIMAPFSVSATKQVYFSQGNLLFDSIGTHQCADGTTKAGTWRFAEKQWNEGSKFYWGDSGFEAEIPFKNKDFYTRDIAQTYHDWGVYNAIENGGNTPGIFRTLTQDEWEYLWSQRLNADKLKGSVTIKTANNEYSCTYILPDTWEHPDAFVPNTLYCGEQVYETYPLWEVLKDKGAVLFLSTKKDQYGSGSGYWTASYSGYSTGTTYSDGSSDKYYRAYVILGIGSSNTNITYGKSHDGGEHSVSGRRILPVRLVKDIE